MILSVENVRDARFGGIIGPDRRKVPAYAE